MHDRSKKRQIFLQSYEPAMFGKRENISADIQVSSILRAAFFFSQKIVKNRRFIADFCGDDARPRRMKHTSNFFGGKIGNFRFFGKKIGDFTDFPPIFPQIDFSSAFSSRCRLKIDFSAINRPKKPIFLSMIMDIHLHVVA